MESLTPLRGWPLGHEMLLWGGYRPGALRREVASPRWEACGWGRQTGHGVRRGPHGGVVFVSAGGHDGVSSFQWCGPGTLGQVIGLNAMENTVCFGSEALLASHDASAQPPSKVVPPWHPVAT